MVRDVKFIDQPSLQGTGKDVDLSAQELTRTFNGIVKAGNLLREVAPGLFLREAKTPKAARQMAVARLALARYLASLDGDADAGAMIKAISQMDSLMKGNGSVLLPATPGTDVPGAPETMIPAQMIHLGKASLLDMLLPQWWRIGDPAWASPLSRHRGNWIEQTAMPVFDFLAKYLLMLFLLRGWSVGTFTEKRTEARRRFFDAFSQILHVCGKPGVEQRSLYPHLKRACLWAETDEAKQEMTLLLEMDPTRVRDEQRAAHREEIKMRLAKEQGGDATR
jgi:hypothetical protein